MRVLAVDWSGRLKGAEEYIWLAEVHEGELISLENGRSRKELVDHLIAIAQSDPQTIVGLDFAFSFPAWWCRTQGWTDAREIWAALGTDAERLLDRCEPPFWGRRERPNPNPAEREFRRTELADAKGAKSVFHISGGGTVGTGSLRGMPYLQTLARHGFDVWPFGPTGWPRVIEIYPRVLTGAVNKKKWSARHAFLFERFPTQPAPMLERAAGSDDAFDAAVSALRMGEHADQLAALSTTCDSDFAIEGRIWRPV